MLHRWTIFCTAPLIATCYASISFPPLFGEYPVGTRRIEVQDPSRLDPWTPTPQPRAPILQVWYPILNTKHLNPAPWLPSNTATWFEQDLEIPPGTLRSVQTQTFANGTAIFPLTSSNSTPILVFSPGSQVLCALYTSFLSSLASIGYTVIGIDHPYDSSPMERPNGELVFKVNTTDDIEFASLVRRDDVLWLAEQITPATICGWLPSNIACSERIGSKVNLGIFGHSLGGNTASLAMQDGNTLYESSISLDGPFFAPLNKSGFHGPLLYMAANRTCCHGMLVDEWELIEGWKLGVMVENTTHASFSDEITLKPQIPGVEWSDVGGLKAERMVEIVVTYTKAFWDWTLLGKKEDVLLKKESKLFPEVIFQDLTGDEKHVYGFLIEQTGSKK